MDLKSSNNTGNYNILWEWWWLLLWCEEKGTIEMGKKIRKNRMGVF
jgi:hypothetical protein